MNRIPFLILVVGLTFFSGKAEVKDEITKLEEELQQAQLRKRFTDAITNEEWEIALDCCSERVVSESENYDTKELFFLQTVPVAVIKNGKTFSIGRYHMSRMENGLLTREEGISLAFQISNSATSLSINWRAKMRKIDGDWKIDFEPIPLSKQFEDLLNPMINAEPQK
ncbi:hypothetical protein P0Y35_12170 [Kiritimatiellaeota bacterium B1221]|nr:hypothetical protein [Kiritimatiellaeota bacterium B1221]